MPRLSDRIENVLNEARILLLGGQVLLGFSFRICFEEKFEQLPFPAQLAEVLALSLMTAGLGWLIWPAAFHQLADDGALTERIDRFSTRILDWGLLPLGTGLGFALYPVAAALHIPHSMLIGLAASLLALGAWYGAGLLGRRKKSPRRSSPKQHEGQGDIGDRIKKVLIECRMALPGAQAFLGFQFSIVFVQGFDRLPRSSQWIHFGSLLATTIAIVLLIAPAAYHRLAESGEDTEHFHRAASRLVLAALVFLAPGMCG